MKNLIIIAALFALAGCASDPKRTVIVPLGKDGSFQFQQEVKKK
ncbi:MAG: hypothetical protein V3S69_01915 [Dehalococcoidales bacterium]